MQVGERRVDNVGQKWAGVLWGRGIGGWCSELGKVFGILLWGQKSQSLGVVLGQGYFE